MGCNKSEIDAVIKDDIARIENIIDVWDSEKADEEMRIILYKDDIKSLKRVITALRELDNENKIDIW